MVVLERDNRISELIARKIVCRLSESEEQELNTWMAESERNRKLYERLISTENIRSYQNKREKIDNDESWRKLETVIRPHKIFSLKYIGYISAAVALVGIIYLWQLGIPSEDKLSMETAEIQKIMPGTAKATLVLADGKQVKIEHAEKDSLDINGIKIYANQVIVSNNRSTSQVANIEWNKLLVPRGGEYNLVLNDGTKVYLNSDSRLEFPVKFIGKTREVRLYGEAYFQVASSAECPFIVETDKMDVRVTGTEFNVKAYQEESLVQTTLIRGRVSVATGKGKQDIRSLTPSQQIEFDENDNSISVKEVDVNSVIAWKSGQFIFKGNRLEDIMTTLARWYDFEVVYQNNGIKNLTFAGKLNRLEKVDSMLEIIASTDKIRISVKGKTIVLDAK